MSKKKEKESLKEAIKKALANAPEIPDCIKKKDKEETETPWSGTRWHLNLIERRGKEHRGSVTVLKLKKKQRVRSNGFQARS